jgi:hypothetical protein
MSKNCVAGRLNLILLCPREYGARNIEKLSADFIAIETRMRRFTRLQPVGRRHPADTLLEFSLSQPNNLPVKHRPTKANVIEKKQQESRDSI